MKNSFILLTLFAFALGLAQPTTNAPTPTKLQENVISVFSDVYNNVATNYNPGWGQSGTVNASYEAVAGSGNNILVYSNFNYQGTDLTTQNAASMEYLHIDVWTSTATILKVSPINNGTGAAEYLVEIPLVNGGWNSVDLPKSAFTGMTWDSIYQIKFDGQSGTTPSTIYLDNIYFWKEPVDPASDATLTDLKVDGVTVPNFSPSIMTYTLDYPQGTTSIPLITAATATSSGATISITQSSTIPGSATVMVTSQNGNVVKTYTVNYVVSGPATAAPTPPARATDQVVSLFSNSYSNVPVDTWSATWDDSSIEDLQIAGNDTKKINFNNFIGIDFSGAGNHLDLTNFQYFHIDIWIDSSIDLVGKVFNIKLSQWGGTTGEVSALELNLNTGTNPSLVKGQWLSIDLPFSAWSNNTNRNDVAQLVITSNIPSVYFDNLYFHNNNVLSVNENNSEKTLKIYPVPVKAGENVYVDAEVESLEVFSINGQLIKSSSKNEISTIGFNKGVYILNIKSKNGKNKTAKILVK